MNILREAAKKEIEGSKKPVDTDVQVIPISDRVPEESWRRLCLRLLTVVNVAQKQVMLQELAQVTIMKQDIPEDLTRNPRAKKNEFGVTKAEVMMRAPLPPSKTFQKIGSIDPKACQHRWLVRRGGKNAYWYTCQTCPMRWPRLKDEYCSDQDTVPPYYKSQMPSSSR
jgi:hypothetical protein